jgi:hypothetical protein
LEEEDEEGEGEEGRRRDLEAERRDAKCSMSNLRTSWTSSIKPRYSWRPKLGWTRVADEGW